MADPKAARGPSLVDSFLAEDTAPATAAQPMAAPVRKPAGPSLVDQFLSEPAAPAAPARTARDMTIPDLRRAADAVIGTESGGRQFDNSGRPLTSRAGAIGLMQVMPKTAPEAAQLAGVEFDPVRYRTDADYNRTLGTAYLRKQLADFGSLPLALAAYNAGPGATRQAMSRAAQAGDPGNWLSFLPLETRKYVPNTMARYGQQATATPTERGLPSDSPSYVQQAPAGYGENDFLNSLDAGIESYKGGLGAVTSALGKGLGIESMEEGGKEYFKQRSAEADRLSGLVGGAQRVEDVGSAGDVLDLAVNAFGSSLPWLAEFAVTGFGLGSIAKGAVSRAAVAEARATLGAAATKEALAAETARVLGKKLGTARTAGGVAGSLPSSLGAVSGAQLDEAGTTDLGYALPAAAAYSALNAFSPLNAAAIGRGLPKAIGSEKFNLLGRTAATGAVSGLQEGVLNELPQTLLEQGGRASVNQKYDWGSEEAQSERLNAAVVGGLLGAVPGAVGGALDRRVAPVQPAADQPTNLMAPQAPAETPAAPVAGLGRTYDPEAQSEDLSGQLGMFPQFNDPGTGMLMTPEQGPEAPFVDTQTGDLFSPENRVREAGNEFGRPGAGLPTQLLIDAQTGVDRPPVPFSPQGMARRLAEPVQGVDGEPMGDMGGIYAQVADERSPLRPPMPPAPSGAPDGIKPTTARGSQRDIFTGKSYAPGATTAQPGVPEGEAPFTDTSTQDMFGGQGRAATEQEAKQAFIGEVAKAFESSGFGLQTAAFYKATQRANNPIEAAQVVRDEMKRPENAKGKRYDKLEFIAVQLEDMAGATFDETTGRVVPREEAPVEAPPSAAAPTETSIQSTAPESAPAPVAQVEQVEQAPVTVETSEAAPATAPRRARKAAPVAAEKSAPAPVETPVAPAAEPKKKSARLTPAQRKAEAEDKEIMAGRADAAADFDQYVKSEALKAPDGTEISYAALPPFLQEQWLDSPQRTTDMTRLLADYAQFVRAQRLAQKLKLRPNTDLTDGIEVEVTAERAAALKLDFDSLRPNDDLDGYLRQMATGREVRIKDSPASVWLRQVMRDTRSQPYRDLLRQVSASSMDILDEYRVVFGAPKDAAGNPVSGKINHSSKTITISKDTPTEEAVVHEILHAALDGRIAGDQKLAAELRDIMKLVDERADDSDLKKDALENEREFLNYYFTSPAFRSILDATVPGKVESLFRKAINIAKRALAALGVITETAGRDEDVDARMQAVLRKLLASPARDRDGESYMRGDFGKPTASGVQQARKAADTVVTKAMSNPYVRTGLAKTNRLIERLMTAGQLVDSFAKKLPALADEQRIRLEREAFVNKLNEVAGEVFVDLKVVSGDREEYNKLVDLVFSSTLEGFRLDRDIDEAGNKRALAQGAGALSPDEREELNAAKAKELDAAVGREAKDAVRQKYADRAAVRKDAEIAKRTEKFEEMRAQYEQWSGSEQKDNMYTRIFDHMEGVQEREFKLLVDQAMRQYDRSKGSLNDPVLTAAVQAATAAQMKVNAATGEERTKARTELRELIDGILDPSVQKDLRERMSVVDDLRRTYEAARNAYFPLMRFGDFLVVARSKEYEALVAKVDATKEALAKAEADSSELAEIKSLRAQIQTIQNEKHADKASEDAAKLLVRSLQSKVRDVEKNVAGTPLAAARSRMNQVEWEMREMRKRGQDYQVSYFESEVDAEKALDALKAEGMNATKHLREEWASQLDGVGAQFVARMKFNARDTADKEMAEEFNAIVTRMYLAAQPETSALKRRIAREGIAGYSRDMIKSFADANRSHAFYASRIKFADQTAEVMEELKRQAKAGGSDLEAVYNTVRRRQILNHTMAETPITDAMARLGSFWYLALTPAFLMLNLTQNFMFTFPELAARYGYADAGKMLLKGMGEGFQAYKTAFRKQGVRELLTFEPDFQAQDNFSADEKNLFARLQEIGKINFTQTVEMVDRRQVGDLSTVGGKAKDMLSWAERLGWFLPHHTEVVNRAGAALASYRLARKGSDLVKPMSHDEAVAYAGRVIDATHGDYADSNKPELVRSINKVPGGKLLTLFKSYQQMVVFGIMKNIRDAAFNPDTTPEERKAAVRALTGLVGTHAVMAGSMGIPGFAMIGLIAGLFAGDEDEPYDFDAEYRSFWADALGPQAGEVVSRGVLRALPVIGQLDFAGRVGNAEVFAPFRYADDPKAEGRAELANILVSIGGPAAGIAANVMDAAAGKGNGFTGTMALLTPKAVADVFKASSMAAEGVKTRSGAPLYDPTVVEIVGQSLGFRPSRSAESGEERGAQLRLGTALDKREQDLRDRYVEAATEKDASAVRKVEQEAREFFRKHPDRGTAADLKRSLESRKRRDASYQGGRRVTESEFIEAATKFGNVE